MLRGHSSLLLALVLFRSQTVALSTMRSTIVLVAALAAVVAFTTITTPVAAVNGVCRALAMSGGGDKAAYEAGVLQGLLDNLPAEETSWDVVTGISAGSTLTATFAVFPIGQEQNAVSLAYDIIASLNQTSIYRQWPGGVLEGLLAHSSLFDSTPLRDMITRELSAQTLSSDRLTCMGASHLRSGGFQRFCSPEFVNIESIVNATVASAAIPGVFLAQTYKGETYVDGGTLVNVDVTGAIEGCLSLGYNESQIIVDTIECSGTQTIAPLPAGDESKLTVIPILLRALQMRQYWRDEDDYNAAMDAYPQATFRYRIHPSVPISGSGISFNQTQMLEMEALGENDAAAAVHAGKAKNLHLTRA